MPPLRGLIRGATVFLYTDAAETPKQINPTGLKSGFRVYKFGSKIPARLDED